MIEYRDRPAPGNWFALDVLRATSRKWDWVALMVDIDPDEDHPWGHRAVRQHCLRIPGKHRNVQAARHALEDMMATRH
jgi:hypothetical protein